MSSIDTLRSYRVGGVAIFDLAATMAVFGIAGKKIGYDPAVSALFGIFISVPAHLAFGVETQFTRLLKSQPAN